METLDNYQKNTGPIDSVSLMLLMKQYPNFVDFMNFYKLDKMNIKWSDFQRYMDLKKNKIWN
jgi:hypothetical protein